MFAKVCFSRNIKTRHSANSQGVPFVGLPPGVDPGFEILIRSMIILIGGHTQN